MEEKAEIIFKCTSDNPYILKVFKLSPRIFSMIRKFYQIDIQVERIIQGVILFCLDKSHLDKIFQLADKFLKEMIIDEKQEKSDHLVRLFLQFIKLPANIDKKHYFSEVQRIISLSNGFYQMKEIANNKMLFEFNRGSFYKYAVYKILGEWI